MAHSSHYNNYFKSHIIIVPVWALQRTDTATWWIITSSVHILAKSLSIINWVGIVMWTPPFSSVVVLVISSSSLTTYNIPQLGKSILSTCYKIFNAATTCIKIECFGLTHQYFKSWLHAHKQFNQQLYTQLLPPPALPQLSSLCQLLLQQSIDHSDRKHFSVT